MGPTLVDLPDDILLLVLASLDSARDFRALALSCRRLHRFVTDDGWRVFVRSRFPSLSIPPPTQSLHGWKKTAESLTWQSRCWDKRSLQFQALLPRPGLERINHNRQRGGRLFQPVIDAHFDPETHEELVVWGAGENIVARYRQRKTSDGKPTGATWLRSEGNLNGFKAGYDDVRALAILKSERHDRRAFLTGRDNGDLALLSAEPDQFGKRLVEFRPEAAESTSDGESGPVQEQDTINSLDVLYTGHQSLIAATTKSSLLIYAPPDDESTEVAPKTIFDLKDDVFETSSGQLCGATWMGEDVLALALRGCKDPLRYLTITPTGLSHHTAAKNPDVESLFGIKYGNICPNSLQPVRPPGGGKGATNLLLSAWRDGTCRLQDLRTPSAFDTIYQDNVDPWADMESLMTYGAERFVGGGMNGAAIKIFDFRWTKDYYHTSGLPCMDRAPFSQPSQPFLKTPNGTKGCSRCNHVLGIRCYWHDLSRHIYYRPNASFFLTKALPPKYLYSGVWSLAKPSDLSPNFYIGIAGGIVEANLEPSLGTEPSVNTMTDPNFGFEHWRAPGAGLGAVGYEALPLEAAMMETGDGFAFQQNDRAIRFPRVWTQKSQAEALEAGRFNSELTTHHRLDRRYQLVEDYWPEAVV